MHELCGSRCRFQLCESLSTAAKQLSAVTAWNTFYMPSLTWTSSEKNVCYSVYIYIYMYTIHTHICVYIYIYMYV